ncbi:MAG: hypothetical protein ACR2G3_06585 [Solirubrobacterales bacterium]
MQRHLSSISAEEAKLLASVLGRITGSTCDSALVDATDQPAAAAAA